METKSTIEQKCYHCGEYCRETSFELEQHSFCCQGCKLVYEILSENNLQSYYRYNISPGISPKQIKKEDRFGFLDHAEVQSKILRFSDGKTAIVSFYIPQMHCTSCIWLLENLNSLIPSVIRSQVNFIKKSVVITYQESKLRLRELVYVLAKIGYEPHLDMSDLEGKRTEKKDRSAIYRIGISGFVFGNIMLFSFPEYFSLSPIHDPGFNHVFNFLNLALSIPVIFYCSAPFFKGAGASLNQKTLNIDVPIALGIAVMFIRSVFEILSNTGVGYLDTMAGLVFFMLLGRAFQDKSYKTIFFERNYKSFFPISVMCRNKINGEEYSIPVSALKTGDAIVVRNGELVPADSVLMNRDSQIDYSFVTGESALHHKMAGDLIYAGGRLVGEAVDVKVVKEVSQSYLTQLWNQEAFSGTDTKQSFQNLVNKISHHFTIVIIVIAVTGWLYWLSEGELTKAWNAFTAVLIIACPCALAISSPFTLGNIIRIFGRRKFYLKNVSVIEKLAKVDTIVFDKTGTLTERDGSSIKFSGIPLDPIERMMVSSLATNSSHPLSRILSAGLPYSTQLALSDFKEAPGAGLQAIVNGTLIRIGSGIFTGQSTNDQPLNTTRIYVSMNGVQRGFFEIGNSYRPGLRNLIDSLRKQNFKLQVLSGDNDGELNNLISLFGEDTVFRFNQTPLDKLNVVRGLQKDHHMVMMVGDGLNDAGALKQSDIGISISDDVNNFSPASDAILASYSFNKLSSFIALSRMSRRIIIASFAISLLYNIVGLAFALQGTLSPVIAAILMPVSSVSIILFTSGVTNLIAGRKVYS